MENIRFELCCFYGDFYSVDLKRMIENNEEVNETCSLNGSLISSSCSSGIIKLTTVSYFSTGGLSVDRGEVVIEKGESEENSSTIKGYSSFRRNIVCSSGKLTVKSLKGGDDALPKRISLHSFFF
jgi:hypothetical protein